MKTSSSNTTRTQHSNSINSQTETLLSRLRVKPLASAMLLAAATGLAGCSMSSDSADTMSHKKSADMADASDTTHMDSVSGLIATSNPATASEQTGKVLSYNSTLGNPASGFDTKLGLESVTLDGHGDVYATFDNSEGGGVVMAKHGATMRGQDTFNDSMDRTIFGPNTGLKTPKGLDVSTKYGLVFVAELDASMAGIKIFPTTASGDVAPTLTLTPANGARPWDVDYDTASDTAYISLTNGTVAVFENVHANMMAGKSVIEGEDRLITPSKNGLALTGPSNLHGIDFDPVSGALLVSDVGSPKSATDGKLYVIPDVASANGLTDISVSITGPNSRLGNPVDVMFDGNHLYVAEKSNGVLMRFDNILASKGGDVAASHQQTLAAAESVALKPTHLK